LYQLELEHYEKIEGSSLSLNGKANRLATMLRSQMGMAMRGLVVLPLLGGWDGNQGRIMSFDLAGGCYEEHGYAAVGSGAVFARGSLKKLYRKAASAQVAIRTALAALSDAAEDDSGTGGVDAAREIYPVVAQVDRRGYRRICDEELAKLLGVTR
jgi:proteasome beta subunit